ncbi:heme-binding protein [Guyparkeria halophila]|uniref:Heme-binding protein n=1 Tax=Guyparkeria halophila TaxID=47960 RepID=A0ABZ0YUZ7_9GAMM|nr:heme-binding protein [Guyparkeria halophila]WQH15846.1 heme-binding protein [Guyparkeria halophila]
MSKVRNTVFAGTALIITATPLHAAEGTFDTPSVVPEVAVKAVAAAVEACRDKNHQVTAVVVGPDGTPQALKRDRYAGPHSVESAESKAWTAVSFRTDTIDLHGASKPGGESYGIQHLAGVTILGGGKQITSEGRIVGGIGVSGSPSGSVDDECAAAGIEAIQDDLL